MDGGRGKFYSGLVNNLLEYAEYRFRDWTQEELNEANQPDLYYIWEWFRRIDGAPPGQRYQEMAAFATVRGIRFRSWEAQALGDMFVLRDIVASESADRPQGVKERLSKRALKGG